MLSRGLYSFQFSNQISEFGPDQRALVQKAGLGQGLSSPRLSWVQVGGPSSVAPNEGCKELTLSASQFATVLATCPLLLFAKGYLSTLARQDLWISFALSLPHAFLMHTPAPSSLSAFLVPTLAHWLIKEPLIQHTLTLLFLSHVCLIPMLPFSQGPVGVEHGVQCLMVLQLFSPLEQLLHPSYLVICLSCGSGMDMLIGCR